MTLDPLSAVLLSVAVGLASTLSALVPAVIVGRWLARTAFAGRSLAIAALVACGALVRWSRRLEVEGG